jgi:nitrite reductase/ring-hydroxylating ferredoxin subunit
MFLRRRDLMVGLFGAAMTFISGSAVAADVPKLKCTRVGQTVIYRNQKFTCIKKSGKLVWGKGVPVPVKSASPKPSPTASPSTSATPTPSPSTSASPSATPSASATPTFTPAKNQIKLANSSDFPTGTAKVFESGRTTGLVASIVLIRDSAGLRALSAECPHAGYVVITNGGPELLCPAHNSLFSAKNGAVLRGPANSGLKSYEVTETGGEIYLTL